MTCSFHVSLLFDLSIKLLSELMILSSALMNSRFAADFGLRKREKFRFSIFDLRCSHLWSYWVEWELVLFIWLCSITCQSIWYTVPCTKSSTALLNQIIISSASIIKLSNQAEKLQHLSCLFSSIWFIIFQSIFDMSILRFNDSCTSAWHTEY